ncbi:KAP family NTPase [Planctomicrobium sp.]|nr:KAP family NTPase [Planctomicrobium sp.]
MKIQTFDDDLFDLQPFALRLWRFMKVEHQFVEGSLVLALCSKFGSGKTTFFNMWRSYLENMNNADKRPLVVSLNAWESDYYGDPLFAIVSSLIESMKPEMKEQAGRIKEAAKDIGSFATAIGNQLVVKSTGIDIGEAGRQAQENKSEREKKGHPDLSSFSLFESRKSAMKKLKEQIKEFVETSEPMVVFLVDELDRCRPDYAISYLETIKHIFDMQGVAFVLAIDRTQLENSAKTAFGTELDFDEYIRKFVHRQVTLPPLVEEDYKKIAIQYVDDYLNVQGLRKSGIKLEASQISDISELTSKLRLTPRQIKEVFKIIGHSTESASSSDFLLPQMRSFGIILMAVLKVGDPQKYELIGNQNFDPIQAMNYCKNELEFFNPDWWLTVLLAGGGLKRDESESDKSILVKVGILKTEEDHDYQRTRTIDTFKHSWGHSPFDRLPKTYAMIEQCTGWLPVT